MKVLITGSGGFIGQSLVAHFLRDGHSIVATYRRTRPELLESATDKIQLLRVDLRDDLTKLPSVDLIM